MVCLSAAGIALIATTGLITLKHNLLEDRKAKLQDLVLLARQTVDLDRQAAQQAGLSEAATMERSKAVLRALRFGKDDYFFADDKNGIIVAHPNPKVENQDLMNAKDPDGVFYVREELEAAAKGGGFVAYRFPRAGSDNPVPKIAYATEYKPYGWIVLGGIYIDDIDEIFWSQVMRTGVLIGMALLLVVGMGLMLRRSVVNPIAAMTDAMRKLAEGDISTEIPDRHRRDEVGAMAQSVQIFKDNMTETARLRNEQDDMKLQSEVEKSKLLNCMADDFEKGVRNSLDMLAKSATEMRETSQGMSATAEQASQRTMIVADVAQQATVNVQTVAVATEELTSSVGEIGRQVTQSTEIAGRAVAEANRTNTTIQGLSSAAQKIGDVVKLISDIASQTNLLALNATIEAARAGDAGKGFAVVANEVKSLASQTAKATDDISAQVAAMQGATSQAVQAIEGISGTIAAINEIATTIASAVEQQGAATQEIARNIQQAAIGTGQVSENIAGVNKATSETGSAAGHVLTSAELLNKQSSTLRADIDSFLANIRAA